MNTPWGFSDSRKTFERGLHWVSTPSHGGFMVSRGLAETILTPAAIAQGKQFADYLAYEEDCDAAIILYELPQTREGFSHVSDAELIESLTYWHLPYITARGISPNPDALQRRKEFDARYGPKQNTQNAEIAQRGGN
jgi:hypothetical protein